MSLGKTSMMVIKPLLFPQCSKKISPLNIIHYCHCIKNQSQCSADILTKQLLFTSFSSQVQQGKKCRLTLFLQD